MAGGANDTVQTAGALMTAVPQPSLDIEPSKGIRVPDLVNEARKSSAFPWGMVLTLFMNADRSGP